MNIKDIQGKSRNHVTFTISAVKETSFFGLKEREVETLSSLQGFGLWASPRSAITLIKSHECNRATFYGDVIRIKSLSVEGTYIECVLRNCSDAYVKSFKKAWYPKEFFEKAARLI